jgi:N-acetyltransferase
MPWPDPVTLKGRHATLEPLAARHRDGLIDAVKDGELWMLWYTTIPAPAQMETARCCLSPCSTPTAASPA